ncbi:hypothetical protein WAF17_10350 [Bernardetia sp. ABR2-2B]|uniref:hypothetical protein n=1 Tax=Bernardetia sp. ABR2-2B TaxID=3127472 RepID=UPI0030D167A9
MKQFVRRSILFFIPLISVLYIRSIYLLISDEYKNIVAGDEIYISIKKSKQKSNKKIVLIGDSVGNQLFSNENDHDSINSLASNQAIGVVGQYLLLNNYLESGNKPERVYMIYNPFSFQNNLNQIFTFHYFLKPFYKDEYVDMFSNTVINQIDKIPFSNFCREPYILTSNWSPDFNSDDSIDYTFLSPISKEYLIKINKLCTTNNISFHIIPAPTKESNKRVVQRFNKEEILGLSLENELTYYLNNIGYFPDSLFLDYVHLKEPKKLRSYILNEMNQIKKHQK